MQVKRRHGTCCCCCCCKRRPSCCCCPFADTDFFFVGKTFTFSRGVAEAKGREVALRLKKVVTRQQFDIVIQASIGSRIVAKERIPPFKKDVLTKGGKSVTGSDRKKKLLQKQKRGKKLMKKVGNVELSQKAFMSVLHRG